MMWQRNVSGHAQLEPGDTLILYTDGLYERRGDPRNPFDHLQPQARALRERPIEAVGPVLVDAMPASRHAEDDVCVLACATRSRRRQRRPPRAPPGTGA